MVSQKVDMMVTCTFFHLKEFSTRKQDLNSKVILTNGFSELFKIVGGTRGDLIPYPSNMTNSAAHSIGTQMTLDLSRHKTLLLSRISFRLAFYSLTLYNILMFSRVTQMFC